MTTMGRDDSIREKHLNGRGGGRGSFKRGLALGLVLGLLAGSVGVATAALGKKGWEKFGPMFQQGYVAGFADCIRIAKALSPDGYIAKTYVLPSKPDPTFWAHTINQLYKEKIHEKRSVPQMMIISGHKMAAKLGKLATKDMRLEGLHAILDARQKAMREARDAKRALIAAEKESAEPDNHEDAGEKKTDAADSESNKD